MKSNIQLCCRSAWSHLAFDKGNNYPLANLHVTMLQRPAIEAEKCATSIGTMRGLEMA